MFQKIMILLSVAFAAPLFGEEVKEKETFRVYLIPGMGINIATNGTLTAAGQSVVLKPEKLAQSMAIEGRFFLKHYDNYQMFISPIFNWTRFSAGPNASNISVDNLNSYLALGLSTKLGKFRPWFSAGGGMIVAFPGQPSSTAISLESPSIGFGSTIRTGIDYEFNDKYSFGTEVTENSAVYSVSGATSNSNKLSVSVNSNYLTVGIRFGFKLF